jgi:hypothetical protein
MVANVLFAVHALLGQLTSLLSRQILCVQLWLSLLLSARAVRLDHRFSWFVHTLGTRKPASKRITGYSRNQSVGGVSASGSSCKAMLPLDHTAGEPFYIINAVRGILFKLL